MSNNILVLYFADTLRVRKQGFRRAVGVKNNVMQVGDKHQVHSSPWKSIVNPEGKT
jgi:hypothetical protein